MPFLPLCRRESFLERRRRRRCIKCASICMADGFLSSYRCTPPRVAVAPLAGACGSVWDDLLHRARKKAKLRLFDFETAWSEDLVTCLEILWSSKTESSVQLHSGDVLLP